MNEDLRIDTVSKNYKILQKKDHYSMSTDSFLLPYFQMCHLVLRRI